MSYDASQLPYHEDVCNRQLAKDRLFLRRLVPFLQPGNCLEVGAGCAQLSRLLRDEHQRDVVASDIEDFFVSYQLSIGLAAKRIDALDIIAGTQQRFDNVIAQGLSTLVTKDLNWVKQTYQSVWDVLEPEGRFIFIFPNAYSRREADRWSRIPQHVAILSETRFRLVDHFRHQLFPSRWYKWLPATVTQTAEMTIGRQLGLRHVFVLEKSAESARVAA